MDQQHRRGLAIAFALALSACASRQAGSPASAELGPPGAIEYEASLTGL